MRVLTQLQRGLFQPKLYTYRLQKEEAWSGLWKGVLLLTIISGLIYGWSAYFGIGSEYLSGNLTELPPQEYEMHKTLYMAGQVLRGLFYGTAILLAPALFFWALTDIALKPLISIQMLVLVILLFEKLILIPINLSIGLAEVSSLFSLGPIAQALMDNQFIILFFAGVTLFKLWAVIIQYRYIKELATGKRPIMILVIVLGLNLVLWLLAALFSFVQFEKII
ncbi:hypothetical protein [Mesobacillus harenae]|uniref:hypothetical protein n=1 Tax=Mesobacillus harenae TaxID=2213203 RepID=UPI0015806D64|nr:hypothetical protein [Mesobacillus harenae]